MIPISTSQRSRVLWGLVVVLSFALSRMLYGMMGVRFDASTLDWYWQYLDVELLRNDLLKSLYYLHAQPPGFNLFLGTVLKWCGDSADRCFHAAYMVMGLAIYGGCLGVLRRSGVARSWAVLLSFLFMISPSAILYENWLFYTYPVAALLVLSAWSLSAFEQTGRGRYAGVFLGLIGLLCMSRSSYHLVYLVACTGLILLPRRVPRKRIGWVAAVVCGVVLAWYLKNAALFGFFGGSSWTGMNVYRIASHAVGREAIQEQMERGHLPEIAGIKAFSPVTAYPGEVLKTMDDYPDHPALTKKRKDSGEPNFNHAAYLAISRQYGDVSKQLIRENRPAYGAAVFDAMLRFSRPSWQYWFFPANREAIAPVISLLTFMRGRDHSVNLQPVTRILFGVDEWRPYPIADLWLIPLLVMAAIMALPKISRMARRGGADGLGFVFMTMTVWYGALLGCTMEYGENNRFRVEMDPLFFLLAILIIMEVGRCAVGWITRQKTGRDSTPAGERRQAP